jgi:7-keto-8-aminopelargonate synthetase-like enzyme
MGRWRQFCLDEAMSPHRLTAWLTASTLQDEQRSLIETQRELSTSRRHDAVIGRLPVGPIVEADRR